MIFIAIVGCCADFKEPGFIGPESLLFGIGRDPQIPTSTMLSQTRRWVFMTTSLKWLVIRVMPGNWLAAILSRHKDARKRELISEWATEVQGKDC